MKISGLIVLVTFVMLMIYQNQTTTTIETTDAITTELVSVDSDLRVKSLRETDYASNVNINTNLISALRDGCMYGKNSKIDGKYSYTISKNESIVVKPVSQVERYLNRSIGNNYFIEMECRSSSGLRTLSLGSNPPKGVDINVKYYNVPTYDSNVTKLKFYRWY